jgi:carbonic anhydrase
MLENDPEFFSRLEHIHKPKYLWIGCSDSRVPANQITGLAPGEVFVHRNIANMVQHTDFNCLSVLQFALDVLKVEHVIVCGHYGCSGIRAAMDAGSLGFVENWLRHIKDVHTMHRHEIDAADPDRACNQLTEWNVKHQVLHVAESDFVNQAWERGQRLAIHGWIYALSNGIINDLQVTLESRKDVELLRNQVMGGHIQK